MGTEYEKIYNFRNLYRAYKLTQRGKRRKEEVIKFELKETMLRMMEDEE